MWISSEREGGRERERERERERKRIVKQAYVAHVICVV